MVVGLTLVKKHGGHCGLCSGTSKVATAMNYGISKKLNKNSMLCALMKNKQINLNVNSLQVTSLETH
jgi:hypothetical protein